MTEKINNVDSLLKLKLNGVDHKLGVQELSSAEGAGLMSSADKVALDTLAGNDATEGSLAKAVKDLNKTISDNATAASKEVDDLAKGAVATNTANIAANKAEIDAINDEETGILATVNGKLGAISEGKTVAEDIAAAQAAAEAKVTALDNSLAAVAKSGNASDVAVATDKVSANTVEGAIVELVGVDESLQNQINTIVNTTIPTAQTAAETTAAAYTEGRLGNLGKVSDEEGAADHTVETYVTAEIAKVNGAATELTGRVEAAETAIDLLNDGEDVDGSVAHAIKVAFNDFATKVSDDKVVNTFKELLDYAANHQGEFTELVAKMGALPEDAGVDTVVAYAEKLAAAALSDAKDYTDGVIDALAGSKTGSNSGVSVTVTTAKGEVSGVTVDATALDTNAQGYATAVQNDIDGKLGEGFSSTKTVAAAIKAVDDKIENEGGLKARISTLEAAVGEGGSVANQIKTEIEKLDSTKEQTAGADGLSLKVVEEDGKITSISGSIATNTYDAYGSAKAVQGETSTTVKALEDLVGEVPADAESDTVVEYAKEVADAAEANVMAVIGAGYSNTATVATKISGIETEIGTSTMEGTIFGRLDTLQANDTTAGSVKKIAKDAAELAAGNAKTTIDAYTVNGHKISENPVLNGADVALTGYENLAPTAADALPIAATDTVNAAIAKLEHKANLIDAAAGGGIDTLRQKVEAIYDKKEGQEATGLLPQEVTRATQAEAGLQAKIEAVEAKVDAITWSIEGDTLTLNITAAVKVSPAE